MRTHTFVRLTAVLLLTLVFAARFASPALAAAPANDEIANAIELGYPGSDVTSTFEATQGAADDTWCGFGPSVWYRFTGIGANVQVNTFGSDYDTVLTLFDGALNRLDCNDDTGGLQSAVTFFAESGATYYLMVNGFSGGSGNVIISTVEPPPPPVQFSFEFAIDTTTVDAKTGQVTLGGTINCTTAGSVEIYLSTMQRAGRVTLQGEGYTFLNCDASGPVRWSTQFAAANGIFKGGKATVSGAAYGYAFDYQSGSWFVGIDPTEIRLTGAH